MVEISSEIKSYYDCHSIRKLRDFVEGNGRVERAWKTIAEWAPSNPQRILEIGCGIGDISWRMSSAWPEAKIVGVDISPRSLEMASKLFGSSRVSFSEGPLVPGKIAGQFDLIVLIDVFEHIAISDRPVFQEALRELRNDLSRIVLSFPTPRSLAWLRQNHPEMIQPIDENVDINTIMAMALNTTTELLMYREICIGKEGDYAHAVLGKWNRWNTNGNASKRTESNSSRIQTLFSQKRKGLLTRVNRFLGDQPRQTSYSRSERLALIRERLGPEYYSDQNS